MLDVHHTEKIFLHFNRPTVLCYVQIILLRINFEKTGEFQFELHVSLGLYLTQGPLIFCTLIKNILQEDNLIRSVMSVYHS